jgi:long-chain acyl-CoA synthetase
MTPALIYLDDFAVTRDEVLQRAARAATGLDALGVSEGDTVALLLRNDHAFFEVQQAAALIGAYSVPVNWHGKSEEVSYILQDARPRALVAHADLLAPLRGQLPSGLHVFVVPTPAQIRQRYGITDAQAQPAKGEQVWAPWADGFASWQGTPRRSRATMIYTSGTTGHPKGVKRNAATPDETAAYVEMIRLVYGIAPGVRALVAGPLYHASPNAYGRQALPNAEVLVLQSKFDPEETLAVIERHRITHAVMVPTMFVHLLKLPQDVKDRYDVSSIRWVTHTGAPCAPDVKKAFMQWWGPVVYETYGGSEVGTATLATPQDAFAYPGSVGVPTPGTRIAFYGEDGTPVAPGEVGEIYARVPAYADFTYLNHEGKRAGVERDGLVSLGDVGYLKDGHLYLCDRRSDMVISAGVNIYPAEIEMVLLQCPGAQDCAVFGIPDAEFGESLCAVVQPLPGVVLTADEVRGFLEARLARYKVPRRVEFHASLPREDSGKIFKRRLRDPFWVGTGRNI